MPATAHELHARVHALLALLVLAAIRDRVAGLVLADFVLVVIVHALVAGVLVLVGVVLADPEALALDTVVIGEVVE